MWRSSRRAASLGEVLISSGLLLLITGIALQFFVPLLERYLWLDSKQDHVQGAVLFREYAHSRLSDGWITGARPGSLEFYLPDTVATDFGRLARIGANGLVRYDTSRPMRVVRETRGADVCVVERAGTFSRVLWNLGEGGRFAIDKPDVDTLRFAFYGLDRRQHERASPWESSILLVHPAVEFTP